MDTQKLRELAESAEERANRYHKQYQDTLHATHLNDAFYWWGHANAYKGVVAMIELATIVDDERDAEPTCP